MKITFVSGNLTNGGAQRVIAIVANRLAEMGQEVSIILFSRNENEYKVDENIKLYSLASNYDEYKKIGSIKRIIMLRRILKAIKPDVATGFLEGGYGLYIASLGLRIKKVASSRIDPIILFNKKGFRACIDRLWFKKADAVVVQTREQMKHAKNNWNNMSIVENPVPEYAMTGYSHSYSNFCCRFIMVGRLDEQKNYELAIEAMIRVHNLYPDVTMDIFGKGKLEQQLRKKIEMNNLDKVVILKGWTQDVTTELAEHDCFLLTSDYEGMPNALMEAMAAGLPVISTDCKTGPADLIDNGINGFLIKVGDVDELTKNILKVIEMTEDERRNMGRNAVESIERNYNEDVIAKKWLEVFNNLRD